MRKFAIRLLALFRRVSLLWRKLRGKTADDVAQPPSATRRRVFKTPRQTEYLDVFLNARTLAGP